MDSSVLIGVAWLVIGAGMIAATVAGFRKAWSSDAPLPLFVAMERRGITLDRAETAVGMTQLVHATRRCMFCAERAGCERGETPAECPNEEVLRRSAASVAGS